LAILFLATNLHEETRRREERKLGSEETEKIRKRMVSMGNTLMKRGTMTDRESKIFAGSRGGFYKKRSHEPAEPLNFL
jgi:hypothetical protein